MVPDPCWSLREELSPGRLRCQVVLQMTAIPLLAITQLIGALAQNLCHSEWTGIWAATFEHVWAPSQNKIPDNEWTMDQDSSGCQGFQSVLQDLEIQPKRMAKKTFSRAFDTWLQWRHLIGLQQLQDPFLSWLTSARVM